MWVKALVVLLGVSVGAQGPPGEGKGRGRPFPGDERFPTGFSKEKVRGRQENNFASLVTSLMGSQGLSRQEAIAVAKERKEGMIKLKLCLSRLVEKQGHGKSKSRQQLEDEDASLLLWQGDTMLQESEIQDTLAHCEELVDKTPPKGGKAAAGGPQTGGEGEGGSDDGRPGKPEKNRHKRSILNFNTDFNSNNQRRWNPAKPISVFYDPVNVTAATKAGSQKAFAHVESKVPCLKFVDASSLEECQTNGQCIRIISDVGDTTGCNGWSYVGYVFSEKSQDLFVSSGCGEDGTYNIMPHEIGHALGMSHTQSRWDRDEHLEIIWDNVERKSEYVLIQTNEYTDYQNHQSPYDWKSMMHYWNGCFGFEDKVNGGYLPTFNVLDAPEGLDVSNIGRNSELSEGDTLVLNRAYCEGASTPTDEAGGETAPEVVEGETGTEEATDGGPEITITIVSSEETCIDFNRNCAYNGSPACRNQAIASVQSIGTSRTFTRSGLGCIDWALVGNFNSLSNVLSTSEEEGLLGNVCQNPDGDSGPWCFYSMGLWGLCFPDCPS